MNSRLMLLCLFFVFFTFTHKAGTTNKDAKISIRDLKAKSLTKKDYAKLDTEIENIVKPMMYHSSATVFKSDYENGLKLIKKYGKAAFIMSIENHILNIDSCNSYEKKYLSDYLLFYMEFVTNEEYNAFIKRAKSKIKMKFKWKEYPYHPRINIQK